MPRRFTDAKALLGDLLDRHEAGSASPIAYPDYDGFASVVAADSFVRELRKVENLGAVAIANGKGNKRDHVAHVRLIAAAVLYGYLGRTPIARISSEAYALLIAELTLHPALAHTASEILSLWKRAKSWSGFLPHDARRLRSALVLAQAILDQCHEGIDYRTFSRRFAGHSKALERVEGAVARLLAGVLDFPPDARPREALRTIGLEKFAPPLLIAGQINFAEADLSGERLVYLGVAPNDAGRLRFRQTPGYLLTIENFASFNRHAIEADPASDGTTIYVGGYPSLATQQALRVLADMLPSDVPIFHWSDIDADGTWIFRTIERAFGRTIQPHLMSPEIAEQFGTPAPGKPTLKPCPMESGIFLLTEYLLRDNAKVLEQEELDPCVPGTLRKKEPNNE